MSVCECVSAFLFIQGIGPVAVARARAGFRRRGIKGRGRRGEKRRGGHGERGKG